MIRWTNDTIDSSIGGETILKSGEIEFFLKIFDIFWFVSESRNVCRVSRFFWLFVWLNRFTFNLFIYDYKVGEKKAIVIKNKLQPDGCYKKLYLCVSKMAIWNEVMLKWSWRTPYSTANEFNRCKEKLITFRRYWFGAKINQTPFANWSLGNHLAKEMKGLDVARRRKCRNDEGSISLEKCLS